MNTQPLYEVVSGTDREPKFICRSCADALHGIHECQPPAVKGWFPFVQSANPVKSGNCTYCDFRLVVQNTLDKVGAVQ